MAASNNDINGMYLLIINSNVGLINSPESKHFFLVINDVEERRKSCNRCYCNKSLEEFTRTKGSQTKIFSVCNICSSKRNAQNIAENDHKSIASNSVEDEYNGLLYEIEDLEDVIAGEFHNCESENEAVKFSLEVLLDTDLK